MAAVDRPPGGRFQPRDRWGRWRQARRARADLAAVTRLSEQTFEAFPATVPIPVRAGELPGAAWQRWEMEFGAQFDPGQVVFRVVSEADWQRCRSAGTLDTAGARNNAEQSSAMCASTGRPLLSYLRAQGRVLCIDVGDAAGWEVDPEWGEPAAAADWSAAARAGVAVGEVRTWSAVPLSAVIEAVPVAREDGVLRVDPAYLGAST